jgi:hypothetical protein
LLSFLSSCRTSGPRVPDAIVGQIAWQAVLIRICHGRMWEGMGRNRDGGAISISGQAPIGLPCRRLAATTGLTSAPQGLERLSACGERNDGTRLGMTGGNIKQILGFLGSGLPAVVVAAVLSVPVAQKSISSPPPPCHGSSPRAQDLACSGLRQTAQEVIWLRCAVWTDNPAMTVICCRWLAV